MNWLVFSYSLPGKASSSPRVTLWRHLRRSGAASLKGGVYVLPGTEDCIKAFQSLAQRVQQANGESMIMYVEHFEGLNQVELVDLFRRARAEEYGELEVQIAELEKLAKLDNPPEDKPLRFAALEKLRKQYAEIQGIDFFDCSEAAVVASHLSRVEQILCSDASVQFASVRLDAYQDKRWVTRPRPRVDRLACIWLIRRFIDRNATIRYDHTAQKNEVAFDMTPAEFGHRGNRCTFEVMVEVFELKEPALQAIAEIVHEIDLQDGYLVRSEVAGVAAIIEGWLLAGLSDTELEVQGMQLFEGLYAAFQRQNNKRA